MSYNYVKKIGGTDNGIHLCCPKCKSTNVVIVLLDEGHYGVCECNDCQYKDLNVKDRLNGIH